MIIPIILNENIPVNEGRSRNSEWLVEYNKINMILLTIDKRRGDARFRNSHNKMIAEVTDDRFQLYIYHLY
jgi:hypothetical protein